MYSSIIHHLYIVLYVHHPKSSLLPSPFIPPFTLFYLPPPPFPLVINHHTVVYVYELFFFCLIPLSFSLSPLTLSPFSISMSLFLFVCYFILSIRVPNINEIIWYLSFSDWLMSLRIILSRFIHAVTKGKISFFFMAE